jgi:glyoxylase-like metal-dependent hydrolase (beta-lactamase superfamily II)
VTGNGAREVLAIRYCTRATNRAENYLNQHLYGEPNTDIQMDYYFWVIRDGARTILVDTGFSPAAGDRRRRAGWTTPAGALPTVGIDPASVDAIVVSHAHWDHTGNLHQFPQAQIVISQAEYDFWTSPMARRSQFVTHAEADEIAYLQRADAEGRLTLITRQHTLAGDVELIEVGGHTPGQLVVSVPTATGTVVLASDAVHFYEEVERDRPFAVVTDLAAMYRAYDLLAGLAARPGTSLVAGHDPLVRTRFAQHPAGPDVTDLTAPAKTSPAPATGSP